ncbi:CRAL/TRIO domain-containing protein [Lactarius akahatsu]|uniref:CRAL/TRIO domain-containing protein n=1 Tax=Lactarius akahatsu TaxID=416441 RepID=A0AAD4LLZ7_9AGAM|nr:CRAL/TRIO domain-containing protein [Lactarius akahatsu]
MSKTTKLFLSPAAGTVIKPIYEYDDEQKEKLQALREYAYSLHLPDTDSYAPWERRWLDKPDTLPRYLRASKWKLDDARKRIKGTVEWRREFKPELIPPEEVKIEAATGKMCVPPAAITPLLCPTILTGFDVDGRPIIYMRPGRENTETSPRQLRHLVYILERAKDLMPPGQESLMIVVDYKSTTLRTNPSISVARKVLTILQYHYVETLGRALVVNLPTILSFFYKGIAPFLDPVTRDKMRFNPDLFELVPREHLDADFGGEYRFEFDHEAYWSQLIEACGIAPDGTRIGRTEREEPSPRTQPTDIASATDHSPSTTVVGTPDDKIGVVSPEHHEVAFTGTASAAT